MRFIALSLLALVPAVLAACADTTPQYNSVSGFNGPRQCPPTSPAPQVQDLGQTTQDQLTTTCRARCKSLGASQCQLYIGVLRKAADSNLQTGQCYYYATYPAAPLSCADYPTTIFAESVDNTNQCFASSAAAATPYCSSFLNIPTSTRYTSTSTPYASTVTTSTYVVVTSTCGGPAPAHRRNLDRVQYAKRAAAPQPACLNTKSIPASRISSACSCLSVSTTVLSTYSTAPTVTSASTTVVTSTSTSTKYGPVTTALKLSFYTTDNAEHYVSEVDESGTTNFGNGEQVQLYLTGTTLYDLMGPSNSQRPAVQWTYPSSSNLGTGIVLANPSQVQSSNGVLSCKIDASSNLTCTLNGQATTVFYDTDPDGFTYLRLTTVASSAPAARVVTFKVMSMSVTC